MPYEQVTDSATPPQAELFNLSSSLLYSNFNFFGLTYLLPFLGLLIAKVVHCCSTEKEKKLKAELAVEFFHELWMHACMFNLTFLVACLAIYYQWGNLADVTSEAVAAVTMFVTVSVLVYFFINPVDFYRFRLSFKAGCLTFNHYYFHALCILLSVLFLALLPQLPYLPFIPQALMLLYTIIMRPYQFFAENVRSAFNYLVMLAITGMGFYYWFMGAEIKREFNNFIYAMAVEGALTAVVVWAWVVVIKDFVNKYYLSQKKKKDLVFYYFDEQETIRKVEQIVLRSSMYQPADVKDFVINEIETPAAMERKRKEMKRKEREMEFCESVRMKPEERDVLLELKKSALPDKKEAIQIFHNKLNFIRYQKAIQESENKFTKDPVDPKLLQIFD